MIGQAIIQIAKEKGFGKIIAIDLSNEKLNTAKETGATHTLNPETDNVQEKILKLTCNRGTDVAFEAVGLSSTLQQAISVVRRGGSVTLVGNVTPKTEFPMQHVVTRQIRVQGSCAICGEYPAVLDMLSRKQIDIYPLLSLEAPLAEGAQWFNKLYNHEEDLVKVILKPEE